MKVGVVVYTAISNGFERTFKEPLNCSGATFYAYRDGNATIPTKPDSCWQLRQMTDHLRPEVMYDPRSMAMRNSAFNLMAAGQVPMGLWKACPHLIQDLKPFKYAIFLDGTVQFRAPVAGPMWQAILGNTSMLSAFEHCAPLQPSAFERCRHGMVATELYQQIRITDIYPKPVWNKTVLLDHQRYLFHQSGFRDKWFLDHPDYRKHVTAHPREYGVWWSGFLVWNLANKDTARFGDTWWMATANHSQQTQVTLSFASWRTGLLIHSLPAHGVKGSWVRSSLHVKMAHKK